MPTHATATRPGAPDSLAEAAGIAERTLKALMIPDPETGRQYIAPDLKIGFTGNRAMKDSAESAAFNKGRYNAWNDSAEIPLVRAGHAQS